MVASKCSFGWQWNRMKKKKNYCLYPEWVASPHLIVNVKSISCELSVTVDFVSLFSLKYNKDFVTNDKSKKKKKTKIQRVIRTTYPLS